MAYMERDTGPTGPIAVHAGRGFGKTVRGYNASGAWLDEAETGMRGRPWTSERKTALTNHQRDRKASSLWRRRYESGPSHFGGTHDRPGAAVACPHLERIWLERPHPRYGKSQPHFVPRDVPAEDHKCLTGVTS